MCFTTADESVDVPATRESADITRWDVTKAGDPVIICPGGFGHVLQRFHKEAPAGKRWIFIEPCADFFQASLSREPWWPKLLMDPHIKFFIGHGAMEACVAWARENAVVFSQRPGHIAGRRTLPEQSNEIAGGMHALRELVASARASRANALEELDRHYQGPRATKRVALLEPDHMTLAPSFANGLRKAGCETTLVGAESRMGDIYGPDKELIYLLGEKPDLIVMVHHNPLPLGAGELWEKHSVPSVLLYVDHPWVVQPIVKDPPLFTRACVFDANYETMLRDLGHRDIRTLPIGACLPLCDDWTEELEKAAPCEGQEVSFLGGPVGRQYLELRERWSTENPDRLSAANALILDATCAQPPDTWVAGTDLQNRLAAYHLEFDTELFSYLLQGVSYQRRLRYLSVAAPMGLRLYGGRWRDPAVCGELTACAIGERVPYGAEVARLYNRSAININILDAMMVDSINVRTFDVMASGGFLLNEYRPIYEKCFTIREELDCFRTPEELIEKIAYYLAHPAERREIAKRGRERVLHEYTIADRMRDLVGAYL